jgi:hypothetical protein
MRRRNTPLKTTRESTDTSINDHREPDDNLEMAEMTSM